MPSTAGTTTATKFRVAALLLAAVVTFGTVGYHVVEGWDFGDCLYMTVVTVSTVGFQEVHDLSDAGRAFTLVLIVTSLGVFAFAITTIASYVLEGQFREVARRRRMFRSLARMKGHCIVCGSGEMALQAGRELRESGRDVVFVTQDEGKVIDALGEEHIMVVSGPPTSDATLAQARVAEAAGLVAALESDADNLFVVITARNLAPDLLISARCELETSLDKLRLAGADHVVLADVVGGTRLASALLRPGVVAFLDSVIKSEQVDLRLEEAMVPQGCPLCDMTLAEAQVPQKTGLIVIAVKKAGEGAYRFNPGANTEIGSGDTLIVMGYQDQIESLRELVGV